MLKSQADLSLLRRGRLLAAGELNADSSGPIFSPPLRPVCSSAVAGSWPNGAGIYPSNSVVTYCAGRTRSVKLRLAFGITQLESGGQPASVDGLRHSVVRALLTCVGSTAPFNASA